MNTVKTARIWVIAGVSALVGFGPWSDPVRAAPCTVIVVAPASIQGAINASAAGDTICLSDGQAGEIFQDQQPMLSGDAHSGVTLRPADGAVATLDGSGFAGGGVAIRVVNTRAIVIQDLNIQNYLIGIRGDGGADNITVEGNSLDNISNGIATGPGFGGVVNPNIGWNVEANTVNITNIPGVGVQLNACSNCTVKWNIIDSISSGIVISATGGEVVQNVEVADNTITGGSISGGSISILAIAAGGVPNQEVLMQRILVVRNTIDADAGITVTSVSNPGSIPSTVNLTNVTILGNTITCFSDAPFFLDFGFRVNETNAELDQVRLIQNTVSGCRVNLQFQGSAGLDDVKVVPPGSL